MNNKTKDKNTMKNKKINFVSADNGKLVLHMNDTNRTQKSSANPIILAAIMDDYGFDDVVMASSPIFNSLVFPLLNFEVLVFFSESFSHVFDFNI